VLLLLFFITIITITIMHILTFFSCYLQLILHFAGGQFFVLSYTFPLALRELHIISFLAVVKPAIMFTAGTHRRRRPPSLFFAHLAAAVAPTLHVMQTHGLHTAATVITT
jgi:hypothetical protein